MFMMPRTTFFHIQKTGGSWVREALKNCGIQHRYVGDGKLLGHDYPQAIHKDYRVWFAFVRNPVTWYRSFWSYRMLTGWSRGGILDECSTPVFTEFLEKALVCAPGYVTQNYEMFLGKDEESCLIDFVGRQENLVEDLITVLKDAGEIFNEDIIRATPATNTAEDFGEVDYPQELKERVAQSEERAMKRFGYEI